MRAIDPRPSIYMQMGLPVVQAGGRAADRPVSWSAGRPSLLESGPLHHSLGRLDRAEEPHARCKFGRS